MVKAQFMQMWDGLETSIDATVVVMGATNRPKDVDKAILRRMPATFHIGLPDIHQRKRYDLLKFIFYEATLISGNILARDFSRQITKCTSRICSYNDFFTLGAFIYNVRFLGR